MDDLSGKKERKEKKMEGNGRNEANHVNISFGEGSQREFESSERETVEHSWRHVTGMQEVA